VSTPGSDALSSLFEAYFHVVKERCTTGLADSGHRLIHIVRDHGPAPPLLDAISRSINDDYK
jgi:hypothetical protein